MTYLFDVRSCFEMVEHVKRRCEDVLVRRCVRLALGELDVV